MSLNAQDLHHLLLVRDSLDADGSWVLATIVKLALGLDGQHSMLLVASKNTAPHYANVFRKVGLNMPQLADAGRLAVIDALRPPLGQAPQLIDLRTLHTKMHKAASALVTHGAQPRPLLLVVDDLTSLYCAVQDVKEWPAFLHACCLLPGALSGAHPAACTAALVHGDVDDDEKWLMHLDHAAATVVDVLPLQTGQSAELRGRVMVCRKDGPLSRGTYNNNASSFWKLGVDERYFGSTETGVRILQQV